MSRSIITDDKDKYDYKAIQFKAMTNITHNPNVFMSSYTLRPETDLSSTASAMHGWLMTLIQAIHIFQAPLCVQLELFLHCCAFCSDHLISMQHLSVSD